MFKDHKKESKMEKDIINRKKWNLYVQLYRIDAYKSEKSYIMKFTFQSTYIYVFCSLTYRQTNIVNILRFFKDKVISISLKFEAS